MDRAETYVITTYIRIIVSGWINNGKVLKSLENIYNKKCAMNIVIKMLKRVFYKI